jgi:hypothetical protein
MPHCRAPGSGNFYWPPLACTACCAVCTEYGVVSYLTFCTTSVTALGLSMGAVLVMCHQNW